MSSCKALPDDIWKLVMQYVPVLERLRVCVPVSKALYRAAVAATDQLEVPLGGFSSEQTERFWQWTDLHGRNIRVLLVPGSSPADSFGTRVLTAASMMPVLSRLPCQHLCQLELSRCSVQLGPCPSNNQPGVLQACTAITQLVLDDCNLPGGRTSLAALSGVPALCRLRLCNLRHDEMPRHNGFDLPAAVLSCLQQLTHFEVRQMDVSIQHISCLQKLQQLRLSLLATASITPSNTPDLDQLTALQDLELCGISVDPAALHGCTTLHRLSLESVQSVSSTAAADGPQLLLHLIARLQQLQQLELNLSSLSGNIGAYTALSASSNLQLLNLRHVQGLPAGVWQHGVFRPGQRLPALQHFTFELYPTAPALFTQHDVAALVSCCPALRVAVLHTQPKVQLTLLSQLPALEALTLRHADVTTCGSLSALRGLRYFQTLKVFGYKLRSSSLMPLTSLRALTEFSVCGSMPPMRLYDKGPASEPDVWMQLMQRCQPLPATEPWQQQGTAATAAAAAAVSSQLSSVSAAEDDILALGEQMASSSISQPQ